MDSSSEQIVGIDSLVVSSAAALANAQSNAYLGQKPAFWGRYLYAPGQMDSSGQRDSHYSAAENAFLRSNNIRLMPIARQTTHVDRDNATGIADAKRNVDAIFECVPADYLAGADPRAFVFLDVEGPPSLSAAYYEGWASTIASYSAQLSGGRAQLLPAIYAGTKDATTWIALRNAMGNGAACFGILIYRVYYGSPVPRPWDDNLVTPAGGVIPPILAWQYWQCPDDAHPDLNFDTSLACPAHSDALMDGLIMPPPR